MDIENPCSICRKEVINNAVECSNCKCANLTLNQIRSLRKDDIYWYCAHCCDIFPFSSLNEEEFLYLNTNINVKEKLCGL